MEQATAASRSLLSSPGDAPAAARTLAVLQPGYLPWLGFFDQMLRADVFVLYDDVQFDKHGWRNRNRVKSLQGQPHWLSVPVKVRLGQLIHEVEIDNRQAWANKQLETIRQFYRKAPFFERYFTELRDVIEREWQMIVDLDIAVLELFRKWLGIETPMLRSSELGVGGDRNERLLNLCSFAGANRYLSGNAAQSYLDVEMFNKNQINVDWQNYCHPEYAQINGAFVPYLSALDLVLNCGPESRRVLAGESEVK